MGDPMVEAGEEGDMSETHPSSAGDPAVRAPQRHAWSPEEDEQLRQLVAEHGACDWGTIAAQMNNRKHWQCRERWHHHLTPELTRTEWSVQEDAIILHSVRNFGQQWSRFRAHLPGRSGHAIKNRYHSLKRRADRLRKQGRLGEDDTSIPLGTPGGTGQLTASSAHPTAPGAPPGTSQPSGGSWLGFSPSVPRSQAVPIAQPAGRHALPLSGHPLRAEAAALQLP
eukprot:CAMPEP_0119428980 /NCGR_PEP_ID=MMETSP1335-20130426/41432_1 /TAXON_ID=259385 /ORGANISM="Chrysoculter rhomboideus, Strain RCC1486" /LENGTH=224 /DNA_ID=CAMNT_0007454685 /DNA_START=3 /DNA_END=673 /DNA_ORIENTATION=+